MSNPLARLLALAGSALLAIAPARAQTPAAWNGRTLDPASMRPAPRIEMPAAGTSVPVEVQPQPTVSVMVNGQGPFRFVVASVGPTELSPEAMKRLGLTATTSGTRLPTVRVDSLRVGDALLRDVLAIAPETLLGRADGILALATLGDLLVTLDYPNRALRLERGALPAPNGRDVLPLVPVGRFWQEAEVLGPEIDVAGRRVPALLNTIGMGGFGTVPARASGVPLAGEPTVVGRAVTAMGPVEIRAAQVAGDVRIGAHTFTTPMLDVVPFPEQLPQGFSVGAQALRHFAVTFDQANRRVRLARADTTAIAMARPAAVRRDAAAPAP